MTAADDRQFPAALNAVAAVTFDYADGDGVEFQPFAAFLSAEETSEWFRAWTGNDEVTGEEFRVFGRDWTGGYAAVWIVDPHEELAHQPVVFLGSEGEIGVVARDMAGFLWLLADGFGPREAIDPRERGRSARPDAHLTKIAEQFAPDRRQSAAAVMARAGHEFPHFETTVLERCR